MTVKAEWHITWNTNQILADFAAAANNALPDTGQAQEVNAKQQLYPGHGVDSDAMRKSTHYAAAGYPWEADGVQAGPGAPERGGVRVQPAKVGDSYVIELGSGQEYAIFYHETRDPFLRTAWEQENGLLEGRLAAEMHARGY